MIGSVVVWGLRAVAIGVAGGLDKARLKDRCFFLGLIAFGVAWVAVGGAMSSDRRSALAVVGGLAGLFTGAVLFLGPVGFIEDLIPESAGWVTRKPACGPSACLWAVSLLTAGVVLGLSRRQRASRVRAT